MAGRVLTLNLNWNGLNFLGLHVSCPILSQILPPSPELLREPLQMTSAWHPVLGDRPRDLGSGRPGARAS